MGVLKGFILGYCWSGLSLWCQKCWTGRAAWGVGGTWCCGFLPSLLYTLPESGSKRRGHQPSGVGNGTSQRWEVSISCVLLSLLGTDQPSNDFVKWSYNGGVSPSAVPFTLQTGSETHWQIPLPFTTTMSHFVVP